MASSGKAKTKTASPGAAGIEINIDKKATKTISVDTKPKAKKIIIPKSKKPCWLDSVPLELWYRICEEFDPKTLIKFGLICRPFKSISDDKHLWAKICEPMLFGFISAYKKIDLREAYFRLSNMEGSVGILNQKIMIGKVSEAEYLIKMYGLVPGQFYMNKSLKLLSTEILLDISYSDDPEAAKWKKSIDKEISLRQGF